jgi:chromosome segregation ATPase
LGVPSSDLFSVGDLHMARGMPAVLQNLASLSRIAKNSLGWQGDIIGPNVSANASNPTKKWDVIMPGKINVVDLVDDGGESLMEVRQRLQLAQAHAEELQKQLSDLKTENERLKLSGTSAPQAGAPEGDGASGAGAGSLQQLFERYKKDMAVKNSLLKDLDEQCTQLEQRCKELRLDNEALRRAATSASNQASSAAQELKSELDLVKQESMQQRARFEDQIEELKRARDALGQENAKLKATSTDSRKDNAAQIAKLEEDWQAKMKREVAKTQAQLRALQDQNQELEVCVEEMRTENANLRKQASDAEADRAIAVAQSQSLKRELDQTKLDLAAAVAASKSSGAVEVPPEKVAHIENQWRQQLEEKEQRYSSQFSLLEADLKALESQLHGLQEENSNLKEKPLQLTVSPAEQAAAAAARAAAERASRNEEAARNELEKIHKEYESKVEALVQQQARLRDEANDLSAERERLVASLKRQEDAAQAEASSLRADIEQIKKKYSHEVQLLKEELQIMEDKMENLRQEKMTLEERQAEASGARSDALATEEKLHEREEELLKEIEELKAEAEQTRNQLARRTREIDGVNLSLQRQLLALDKDLRAAKNEAEEKSASSSAQIHALEEQLADAEKRENANTKKFEQQIEEMKHEQEVRGEFIFSFSKKPRDLILFAVSRSFSDGATKI